MTLPNNNEKLEKVINKIVEQYRVTKEWQDQRNSGKDAWPSSKVEDYLTAWTEAYNDLCEIESGKKCQEYLDSINPTELSLSPAAWLYIYYGDLLCRLHVLKLKKTPDSLPTTWERNRNSKTESWRSEFYEIFMKAKLPGDGALSSLAPDLRGVLRSIDEAGPRSLSSQIDSYVDEVGARLLEDWGSAGKGGSSRWSCEKSALVMVLSCWKQHRLGAIAGNASRNAPVGLTIAAEEAIPIGAGKPTWVPITLAKPALSDWSAASVVIEIDEPNFLSKTDYRGDLRNWASGSRTLALPIALKSEQPENLPKQLAVKVKLLLNDERVTELSLSPESLCLSIKRQMTLHTSTMDPLAFDKWLAKRRAVSAVPPTTNGEQTGSDNSKEMVGQSGMTADSLSINDIKQFLGEICAMEVYVDPLAVDQLKRLLDDKKQITELLKYVFDKIAQQVMKGGVDYLSWKDVDTVLQGDYLPVLRTSDLTEPQRMLLKLLDDEVKKKTDSSRIDTDRPFVWDISEEPLVPLSSLVPRYPEELSKKAPLEVVVQDLVREGWLRVELGFLCGFQDSMRRAQVPHMLKQGLIK